jgi:orotidine-5'-phosphate decarboxylase
MKSKLIVALDVDGYEKACALVNELRDVVEIFKVGSQLFTRAGPKIVEFIHAQRRWCLLDLKFHDIPNTVAGAVESAGALGVRMLTVHACGGRQMLEAAAGVPNRPLLLGVTVLTSVSGTVKREVLRLAKLAKDCGLDGVISSPQEIRALRRRFPGKFLIVTPGIRPRWFQKGDQQRVMTPAQAVAAGADYIVVGRPITAHRNPAAAAAHILEEMAGRSGGPSR